jgi:hypothetical protein
MNILLIGWFEDIRCVNNVNDIQKLFVVEV